MEIFTIQLGSNNAITQAWEMGIPVLDSTVKTGNRVFSPTWPMVLDVKTGNLPREKYTEMYYQLLTDSFNHNPQEWEALLSEPKIALGCYCKPGDFCHRHLLVNFIANIQMGRGNEAIRMGEIE